MLKAELQSKQQYASEDLKSLVSTDNDEEDDEEENISYESQKKKRNRIMTSSSSPEPTIVKKGRKKACQNPNKKDKAGRTKLFSATTAGHLDKVKELIECGADVNFKDNAGWTPLHEAALKGQFEIAKYLIECGAEINARGFGLDTPLHDACNSNSPECVKLLVDAGADVFALNEAEKRPIDLCNDDECQVILETKMKELDELIARDEEGRSSLHRACLNNELELARSLINQGVDVNAKDNQNATPLHFACALGYLEIAELLIEQGAIVNILGTERQDTPLHEASRHGHQDIVVFLINTAGVDVNMKDKDGMNPYHVSAAYPPIRRILTARMDEVRLEKEACDALDEIALKTALKNEPERQLTREERKIQNYMRTFANMDNQNKNSNQQQLDYYTGPIVLPKRRKRTNSRRKSPSVESDISSVRGNRRKKTTSHSYATKLDPFKKDSSGRTNVHKYAKRGEAEIVRSLLESGANPNEKDYAGWTPLHEASLNGHIEVVKILIQYGANVNAKGGDLDTPLHDATENNHCKIVELLLEHGADPFARNAHHAEPIDIATEHEYEDVMLVLQTASPVTKKKRTKRSFIKKEEDETDVQNSINKKSSSNVQTKKRRLVQAADLEKNKSIDEKASTQENGIEESYLLRGENIPYTVKTETVIKTEEKDKNEHTKFKQELTTVNRPIPTKKKFYATTSAITQFHIPQIHTAHHPYSPAHTPPPESKNSKEKNTLCYSPLYTVQITSTNDIKYYVIDLQVSLFLNMSLETFWSTYSYLRNKRKTINIQGKSRLWFTLRHMIHEEKEYFVNRHLYFISLDDVLDLIKRDFNHLSANLITITLDIGYHDEEDYQGNDRTIDIKLPPKLAMKMGKYSHQFRQ
ncbi:ankyrin repeat-containing domain protein [Cokeromyces recurvatus]|uniref:ankyrin repeat-containing domain protein n=1 Tax=Cokeromyces recurvatus TaxID=90255 RepID=UPI0022209F76|nr:ankyrin repeat-containing domain protein [Cokeromyces recurvatus]KAI7899596.1 ankyrin repeat-containing domain protein [Cokeromyces recurvatus]